MTIDEEPTLSEAYAAMCMAAGEETVDDHERVSRAQSRRGKSPHRRRLPQRCLPPSQALPDLPPLPPVPSATTDIAAEPSNIDPEEAERQLTSILEELVIAKDAVLRQLQTPGDDEELDEKRTACQGETNVDENECNPSSGGRDGENESPQGPEQTDQPEADDHVAAEDHEDKGSTDEKTRSYPSEIIDKFSEPEEEEQEAAAAASNGSSDSNMANELAALREQMQQMQAAFFQAMAMNSAAGQAANQQFVNQMVQNFSNITRGLNPSQRQRVRESFIDTASMMSGAPPSLMTDSSSAASLESARSSLAVPNGRDFRGSLNSLKSLDLGETVSGFESDDGESEQSNASAWMRLARKKQGRDSGGLKPKKSMPNISGGRHAASPSRHYADVYTFDRSANMGGPGQHRHPHARHPDMPVPPLPHGYGPMPPYSPHSPPHGYGPMPPYHSQASYRGHAPYHDDGPYHGHPQYRGHAPPPSSSYHSSRDLHPQYQLRHAQSFASMHSYNSMQSGTTYTSSQDQKTTDSGGAEKKKRNGWSRKHNERTETAKPAGAPKQKMKAVGRGRMVVVSK